MVLALLLPGVAAGAMSASSAQVDVRVEAVPTSTADKAEPAASTPPVNAVSPAGYALQPPGIVIEMAQQLRDVLAGYEDFCAFDQRELHLIEALRTLRLIHYSAWIARRWDDPAFPAAFPWFGTQRYWQDRILELKEQIGAMDEPPLAL